MGQAPSGTIRRRRSGYLRAEPSRFVGRRAELEQLAEPLARSRLVSVVGPAGIGKTRLALRYATARGERYRSVWFCDVSDAGDVEEMTAIALRALAAGARAVPSEAHAAKAVRRALEARPGALVIVDNIEHLLPAAAGTIHEWVQSAPGVRFVVTSRVPLGLPGEELVELGSIGVRDAMTLFIERVRARQADYAPPTDELPYIAEIVRHLGGVPLAIELAAARVGAEDTRELLARVVPRSWPPPQGEAATRLVVARAFSLLSPAEQQTLSQCSVFRGSFTLRAANHVVRLGQDFAAPASEVVLGLARKNLLEVQRYAPLRFAMCEGIRSVAAEVLRASSEAHAVAWRHAEHYVRRANAIARLEPSDAPPPPDAAEDWDDLVAAMAFGAESGRPRIVLRTALAVDALALGSGLGSTKLAYLDEALRMGAAGDLGVLSRALGVRATALYALGRLVEARRDAETAYRLAAELSDRRQMGAMLRWVGESAFQLGDFASAREHLMRALELEEERGEPVAIAQVQIHLGSLYQSLGAASAAREAFERAQELALRARDAAVEARALMGLGWHHFERGDREIARETYGRALATLRRMKMARSERIVVGYMGVLFFDAGDLDEAEEHLRRAAFASRQAGDFRVEGIFEGVRGAVLAALDATREARASLDLSERLLADNAFYAESVAVYRGHLDLAEARAALAAGDDEAARACVEHAKARLQKARTAASGRPPLVRRSDDARMAVAILERAIAAAGRAVAR